METYLPNPELLKARVILITGAGDGLGRVAATACASFGATVVLLGRSVKKLERTYDLIEAAGHPQPAIYPLDLEKAGPDDYTNLAATIDKELGRLDGLLHNAATLGTLTPIQLYNIEEWYRVMQVNLHAPFLMTRACLELMQRSPDASILFISDEVGRQGRAYWGAYGVSKAALEGLMQITAHELAASTSIRVNSLDTGPLRTAMRLNAYPGVDPNTLPLPESVIGDLLYLLGPDSSGVTGQELTRLRTIKNST